MSEIAERLDADGEFWELRWEAEAYLCETEGCLADAHWDLRAAEQSGCGKLFCTRHAEAFFSLAPGTLCEEE